MWEVLTFRRMITPSLLQWIFWLCIVGFVIVGIVDLFHKTPIMALFWLILAPLILRVVTELVMCLFAIHNQLNDIRKQAEGFVASQHRES